MPLIETILAHCLFMGTMDENYARKAAKRYGLTLEAPELLQRFEAKLSIQKEVG